VKKIWLSFWALAALVGGTIAAQASAISDPIIYDTSNSAAKVQVVTVTEGELDNGSTFTLVDAIKFKNTAHGNYGELVTYIPITVSMNFTLTVGNHRSIGKDHRHQHGGEQEPGMVQRVALYLRSFDD
jgi:hypothetical protein